METKANYALVGFFTLLVIAAAFGFVYWMAQSGRGGRFYEFPHEFIRKNVISAGFAYLLSGNSMVQYSAVQ